MFNLQGHSAGKNVEEFIPFCNEVEKQLLQDFLQYNPKRKNGSYVEGILMSITKLGDWVATMVRYLPEREKLGGHRQGEYYDTYGIMVYTAKNQIVRMLEDL